MEVIGQDDDGFDGEGAFSPDHAEGGPQRVDGVREVRGSAIRERYGEK